MAARSDREKAAIASAEKWLKIVDKGKYGESWEESSEYYLNKLSRRISGNKQFRRYGNPSAN